MTQFRKVLKRYAIWAFLPPILISLLWSALWLYEGFHLQTEGSIAILPSPVRPTASMGGTVPLNESQRLQAFVSYLASDSTYRQIYSQAQTKQPLPPYTEFSISYTLPPTEPYTVKCRVEHHGNANPQAALALTSLALQYLPQAYQEMFGSESPPATRLIQSRLQTTEARWQEIVSTLADYQVKAGTADHALRQALAQETFLLLKTLLIDQEGTVQQLHTKSRALLRTLGYRQKVHAYLAAKLNRNAKIHHLENDIIALEQTQRKLESQFGPEHPQLQSHQALLASTRQTLQEEIARASGKKPSPYQTVANPGTHAAEGLFPAINPPPPKQKAFPYHKVLTPSELALVKEMMKADAEIQGVNRRVHYLKTTLAHLPSPPADLDDLEEKLHQLEHDKIALEQTQGQWLTAADHQQFLHDWGLRDEILPKAAPHRIPGITEDKTLFGRLLLLSTLLGLGCALLKEAFPAAGVAAPRMAVSAPLKSPSPEQPGDDEEAPSVLHQISLELPALKKQEDFLAHLQSPSELGLEGFCSLLSSMEISPSQSRLAISGNPRVASGLAVSLAEQGEKVCLLELNGQPSQVAPLFYLDETTGLSDLFRNQIALDTLLSQGKDDSPVGNLVILPSGKAQPLPLSHQVRQLQSLMEVLEKRFDRLILYTPQDSPQQSEQILSWLHPDQWLFCGSKAPGLKRVEELQLSLPTCRLHWVQAI